jgi:hypothetical protein
MNSFGKLIYSPWRPILQRRGDGGTVPVILVAISSDSLHLPGPGCSPLDHGEDQDHQGRPEGLPLLDGFMERGRKGETRSPRER